MPRVIVVPDDEPDVQLMNEHVRGIHLTDDHASHQLAERLCWAVEEAEFPPTVNGSKSYREVPAG